MDRPLLIQMQMQTQILANYCKDKYLFGVGRSCRSKRGGIAQFGVRAIAPVVTSPCPAPLQLLDAEGDCLYSSS